MTSQARKLISALFGRKRSALVGMAALATLTASACAVQETNTYPVEIFSEMHYAQFYRAQEPPRLQPLGSSVTYDGTGDPAAVLDVPATQQTAYDPPRAAYLYSVNCSVCHGVNGTGDGPAEPHLTSNQSFFATTGNGTPYNPPPNLQNTRQNLPESAVFNIVNNGIRVMPRFGDLMTEEQIWQVVSYIYDTQGGLGTAQ